MKTKIKLRNMGCRNHPYWKIIVQGDKKKLTGKYIEEVGFWQPRAGKIVKRSVALNKHKLRYWLSVGAEPTLGVQRILAKFGPEFYPKPVIPFGSKSLYEKPEKKTFVNPFTDNREHTLLKRQELQYKAMLQEEINRVERKKRVQAEAYATLGAAASQQDIEGMKTDDMQSEDIDIFDRVKTFEELQRRFAKHRKEKSHLKGNDLRYNIYLSKMSKLMRKDLGLDVEAYKDYVNNLKMFAEYNTDYQVLATDHLNTFEGGLSNGIFESNGRQAGINSYKETTESLELVKKRKQEEERMKQMRNTVGKLFRDYHFTISDSDRQILSQFIADPRSFLDNDAELALDLKLLQEKRTLQVLERQMIGAVHIENLDKKDLERAGVSRREYDIIRKLIKLDANIFAVRINDQSPYTYTVDLSKYQDDKIPQDCKEMLFRPQKMRKLYERYWQLASTFEVEQKEKTLEDKKLRWNHNNNDKIAKTDEEYRMMDQVLETLERVANEDLKKIKPIQQQADEFKQDLEERFNDTQNYPSPSHYQDGFDFHANKILKQIEDKGFCTKSQLEYLELWRSKNEYDNKHTLDTYKLGSTKFFDDQKKQERRAKREAAAENEGEATKADQEEELFPVLDDQFVNDTLEDQLSHLYPNIKEKADVQKLLYNIKKASRQQNAVKSQQALDTSSFPTELQEKFDALEKLESLSATERNEVLTWFIDEMRPHILNYLKTSDLLQEMSEREQSILLDQLSALQQKCRDHLQDSATSEVSSLSAEISEMRNKIDIIKIEKEQLQMIKEHNASVDLFTQEFSDREALIDQVRDLEVFQDNNFLPTEESFRGHNLKEQEFDQILADNFGSFGATAQELIKFRLKKYQTKVKTQKHKINELQNVIQQRQSIVGRHKLNYAKLYHNHNGGYSMEKLKKILKRLGEDREDGLDRHPFLDPIESQKLDEKLRKVLQLNTKEPAEGDAAEEAAEASEEEDGEKIPTYQERLIKATEENEGAGDAEILKAIMDIIQEKRQNEKAQDLQDGDYESDGEEQDGELSAAKLEELLNYYKESRGVHLADIEDEEELMEKYMEWFKTQVATRLGSKRPGPDPLELAEMEARKDPLYAHLSDQINGPNIPRSLADNVWVPDIRGYHAEMDRIQSTLGRYPIGFRHYENFVNYNKQFPQTTIQDYQEDMNSQISFDEFLVLNQKAFVYEATHNPHLIYSFGFNKLDADNEADDELQPERVVRSSAFKDFVFENYSGKVNDALLNKRWFTKVEALEIFTNLWTLPKKKANMPTHNIYVPTHNTLMPIPKFRDYDKEDQVGNDFTYRTRDSHTPSVRTQPSTLKAHPLSPAPGSFKNMRAIYNDKRALNEKRKHKWTQDRRLGKSRQKNWTSVNMPHKWAFSTMVQRMNEQEEAEAVSSFNMLHRYAKVQTNSSIFDLF